MAIVRHDKFHNQLGNLPRICQCCYCLSEEYNLKSMYQSYPRRGGKTEIYSEMLKECFSIEIEAKKHYKKDIVMICGECVVKLRQCLLFKEQVEETQKTFADYLKQQCTVGDEIDADDTTNVMEIIDTESVKSESEFEIKEECIDPLTIDMSDVGESCTNEGKTRDREYNALTVDMSDVGESCINEGKTRDRKQNAMSSSDVLKRALERTQKNLQLLNEKWKKPREEIPEESLPKDKRERRNFLRRKNYERNAPYKLDKSDRTCKECNQSFPSHRMLVIHMPQHYPNHICTQCGKVFRLHEQLRKHMSRHSTDIVTCDICKRSVKKDSMPGHMKAHNGGNFVYKCYYCPEKYKTYITSINHMVNEHGHQSNQYECNFCSKVFRILSDQKRHIRTVHFGEKPKRNRKPKLDEG